MQLSDDDIRAMLDAATPGPWRVCETTIHGRKYGGRWVEGPEYERDDGCVQGMLIPISGSGGARSFTTRLVEQQDHDHNDANARLIAAAPDLAALALSRGEALAKAEAEIARLRMALTNIDALDPEGSVEGFSRDALAGLVRLMGEIARAALGGDDA